MRLIGETRPAHAAGTSVVVLQVGPMKCIEVFELVIDLVWLMETNAN
jgi:hypothetical protein